MIIDLVGDITDLKEKNQRNISDKKINLVFLVVGRDYVSIIIVTDL